MTIGPSINFRVTANLLLVSIVVKHYDLHASWLKTKIQNVGAEAAPKAICVDNQTMESVFKFTYLGFDVGSESYSEPEIHGVLAWPVPLRPSLTVYGASRDWVISLLTKLRIYTSLVLSVMLYDSYYEDNWQWQSPVVSHAITTKYVTPAPLGF